MQKSEFRGKKAPEFKQKATNGKTYTEKTLQTDTPTLLTFLDGSVANTASVRALKNLQSKHKNKFKIVIFSCQKEIADLPTDWVQMVVPYHSYLLAAYHLGRFPYYVLVTADGKISKQTWQQYLVQLDKKK